MDGDPVVSGVADVSVVIPTLGRPLLAACLQSIAACDPRPAQVIVVDQGGAGAGARELAAAGLAGRVIEQRERGISRALNAALAEVAHDTVLVTHDDCRVRADWVGAAARAVARRPEVLFTGMVRPDSDMPGMPVPSTITSPLVREYREPRPDVLYPNNMAASARELLAVGGFDPRFEAAAEDNDLCFRWLASGRIVRYDPALVVWHRDWRQPRDLRRMYLGYWRAHGQLHAKYLRVGDTRLAPQLRGELIYGAKGALRRLRRLHWGPRPPDESYGAVRGLLVGLAAGLAQRPAPPSLRADP